MTHKTALIVGAVKTAGAHLALDLAGRGWSVIVVDPDEDKLLALASRAPSRIDALPMALDSRSNAERLAQVWGDEPLDILAQFQALVLPKQITLAVRSVMLMTEAFSAGLRSANGMNIVGLPRARDLRDPLSQAAEGAHARALRALSLQYEDAGFRTVGLLATKARGSAVGQAAAGLATGRIPAGNGAVRAV